MKTHSNSGIKFRGVIIASVLMALAMNCHGGYAIMSARKILLANRIQRLSKAIDDELEQKREEASKKLEAQMTDIYQRMQHQGWRTKEMWLFFRIRQDKAYRNNVKSSAGFAYSCFLGRHFRTDETKSFFHGHQIKISLRGTTAHEQEDYYP